MDPARNDALTATIAAMGEMMEHPGGMGYNGEAMELTSSQFGLLATDINNQTSPAPSFPQLPDVTYINITVTVICSVVFLMGVLGNLLVIVVVSRNAEMRTPTNWFLVNLSIADLLVLLICMPSALIEMHAQKVWLLGEAMCRMVPYLEYVVAHSSVLTILAISFERYYAMCYPFKVLYTCTTRRAVKIILTVWVISLLWAVPFILITHTIQVRHNILQRMVTECVIDLGTKMHRIYVVSNIIIFFAVPFLLLVMLYGFIGRQLVRESVFTCSSHKRDRLSSSQTWRTRKQVIIMLAIIIVLFFVCLLPMRIFSLWVLYSSTAEKINLGFEGYLHFLFFSRVMFYLNSAVNPIIYNVISTKFRSAFLRVICRKRYLLRRASGISTGMSRQSFLVKSSLTEADGNYRLTNMD